MTDGQGGLERDVIGTATLALLLQNSFSKNIVSDLSMAGVDWI